jgi:hypothetical protein
VAARVLGSFALAATTGAVAFDEGVFCREFISVNAMGFGEIRGGNRFSAQQVFSVRDRLKMRWVDASAVATEMVEREVA